MPLLAGRTVMITVAHEDDKTWRVNVIPTTRSGDGENPALTTPVSCAGTPEELDAELGRELAGYVEWQQAHEPMFRQLVDINLRLRAERN
jgi:PRTRC genetic system protein E